MKLIDLDGDEMDWFLAIGWVLVIGMLAAVFAFAFYPHTVTIREVLERLA